MSRNVPARQQTHSGKRFGSPLHLPQKRKKRAQSPSQLDANNEAKQQRGEAKYNAAAEHRNAFIEFWTNMPIIH
jgi:hypothetical protein